MAKSSYAPHYSNSWALVIGINAYQHYTQLSFACNDADSITAVLVADLGFPSDQVFVLKDDKATKQAILDAFLSFSDKAKDPDDRVLIFFAGHGTTFDGLRGPVGYLIPVDGDPKNKNTLIRWDDLTRNSDLIQAKHILFVMDACYSGLALKRASPPGTQRFLSDMLQRLCRQVITAGKANELVADGGGPTGKNSIFTGHLLEGLKGAAVDSQGVLTANGLMSYVYQKVSQDNRSEQTPHYGHLDGDGDVVLLTPNNQHLLKQPATDYLIQAATEVPEPNAVLVIDSAQSSFALKNGYGDPSHPNFGRNTWTSNLGEFRSDENWAREMARAYSWLSLVVEPIANQSITMNISSEAKRLSQHRFTSDKPFERFDLPRSVKTTINSVVLYENFNNTDQWTRFLRIDKQGNIEYAESYYVFHQHADIRFFKYVQVIGILWQFIFLSKQLLANLGYKSGVRLLFNLVGARGTILADFAKELGENDKKWTDPLARGVFFESPGLLNLKCPDPNLQLEYKFVLESMTESESKKMVDDAANQLGLAYDHKSSPRCFNYNTGVFSWGQYFNGRQY